MGYCNENVVNTLKSISVAVFACAIIIAPAHPVTAESTLEALVCNSSQGASLTIDQPANDSVVDNSVVEIAGTVSQASQLEVYVDGAYNSVEPLPYNATTYTTMVNLAAGTRTVKIVAVDACQVGNATESVVVTYQPVPAPSVGSQVPTSVGGGATVTGQEAQTAEPGIIDKFIVRPFQAIIGALDLMPKNAADAAAAMPNLIRLVAILAGIALIALSGWIASAVTGFITKVKTGSAIIAARARVKKTLVIIGIITIILVFIV